MVTNTNIRNNEKLEICEIRKIFNTNDTTMAAACEKMIGNKHLSKKSHGNSSVFLAAGFKDSLRFIFRFQIVVLFTTLTSNINGSDRMTILIHIQRILQQKGNQPKLHGGALHLFITWSSFKIELECCLTR